MIAPGRWYGWLELGAVSQPPWRATPAFIREVIPLKTGQGILAISALMALRPLRPQLVEVTAKVLHHGSDLILMSWREEGQDRVVAMTALTLEWLHQHAAALLDARPPHDIGLARDWESADYMNALLLSGDCEAMVVGATHSSFGTNHPTPEKMRSFICERSFAGVEAWLILQGFVPREMEQKWFIYAERDGLDGRLLFRRSWTGVLIWNWSFRIDGERLAFGVIRVNATDEYSYGTPQQEEFRLMSALQLLLPSKQEWAAPTTWDDLPKQHIEGQWTLLNAQTGALKP